MPEVAAFLSTLDEGIIRHKEWNYDYYEVSLEFNTPVRIGEYDKIERISMTYYSWWARTPEMLAATAKWRKLHM